MVRYFKKVTLIKIERPSRVNINEEIQWFSNTLGLFGDRDKEKSKFRIFVELLKAAKIGKGLSSDKISMRTNLSRATVIHHLNFLMDEGLIINKDNRYYLGVQNLEDLVRALQEDIKNVFKELSKIAEEIDKELGLK